MSRRSTEIPTVKENELFEGEASLVLRLGFPRCGPRLVLLIDYTFGLRKVVLLIHFGRPRRAVATIDRPPGATTWI